MAILGKWSGGAVSVFPGTTEAAPANLFPTEDRNDTSAYTFTSATSTLTLPGSGLADGYLIVAAVEIEASHNNRCVFNGRIQQASGTGTFVGGWSGGYERDTSEDRAYVRCWAFVDGPSASSTYRFEWKRDTGGGTPAGATVRSEFQVVPLYYADIGLYTSTSTTASGGTTPVVVTGFTGTDGTNITIASNVVSVTGDNKRYFILSSQFFEGTGGTRTQRWHGLDIDGVQEDAAKAYYYLRDSTTDESGNILSYMIETATATRTIEQTVYRGDGVSALQGGADVDGTTTVADADHTMVVIELNDTAEVFLNHSSANSSNLATSPTDLSIATVAGQQFNDSASFTRSTDTAMDCTQTGDVLLGANISAASNAVADTTRWTAFAEFHVNGTEDTDSFAGNYLRNNQTTADTFGWSANLLGFQAVTAGDDVGVSVTELTGTENGGAAVSPSGWSGFWGINLDTLTAADVTRAPGQADLALTTSTPTIAGAGWKAALDTDITDVELDTTVHIVFAVTHDGDALANDAPQLEYQVDGGGWSDVNASSLNVRSVASGRIADGADVPDLIGSGGTYLTTNAGFDEVDGAAGGANLDWPDGFGAGPNDRVNLQYSITFRSADLTSGSEVVDLRIKGLDAYDVADATATMLAIGDNVTRAPPQADLVLTTEAPATSVTLIRAPGQANLTLTTQAPAVAGTDEVIVLIDVTASSDDAHDSSSGYDGTATVVNFGHFSVAFSGGIRFQSVNVPQGKAVTSATLRLYRSGLFGSPDVLIYADDVDDAPTWSTSDRPSGITQTTASVSWTPTGSDDSYDIDVKVLVDEIFARGGWLANQDLRFASFDQVGSGTNLFQARSFDHSIGPPAHLDIRYSLGAAVSRTVPQANLALTTQAPTVNETHTKTVPQADLTLSTVAPDVTQALVRAVPQTDLALTTEAPRVDEDHVQSVPQADLVIDTKTPDISGDTFRSPNRADLVLTTQAPVQTVQLFRTVPQADLVLSTFAPAVGIEAAVQDVEPLPDAGSGKQRPWWEDLEDPVEPLQEAVERVREEVRTVRESPAAYDTRPLSAQLGAISRSVNVLRTQVETAGNVQDANRAVASAKRIAERVVTLESATRDLSRKTERKLRLLREDDEIAFILGEVL